MQRNKGGGGGDVMLFPPGPWRLFKPWNSQGGKWRNNYLYAKIKNPSTRGYWVWKTPSFNDKKPLLSEEEGKWSMEIYRISGDSKGDSKIVNSLHLRQYAVPSKLGELGDISEFFFGCHDQVVEDPKGKGMGSKRKREIQDPPNIISSDEDSSDSGVDKGSLLPSRTKRRGPRSTGIGEISYSLPEETPLVDALISDDAKRIPEHAKLSDEHVVIEACDRIYIPSEVKHRTSLPLATFMLDMHRRYLQLVADIEAAHGYIDHFQRQSQDLSQVVSSGEGRIRAVQSELKKKMEEVLALESAVEWEKTLTKRLQDEVHAQAEELKMLREKTTPSARKIEKEIALAVEAFKMSTEFKVSARKQLQPDFYPILSRVVKEFEVVTRSHPISISRR